MSSETEHRHFKLYKPYGYISQFISNDKKSHKKQFLGSLFDFPAGTMAVGRLDENSEGLLLLTTDGQLSDTINSRKVEKEYFAQVDGLITSAAIEQLKSGVSIGIHGKKYTTLPCEVQVITTPELPERAKKIRDKRHGSTSWISIIVTEGKFRQIRKMTSAVGFPTLRLVRVRVGDLHINNLLAGEVVELLQLY